MMTTTTQTRATGTAASMTVADVLAADRAPSGCVHVHGSVPGQASLWEAVERLAALRLQSLVVTGRDGGYLGTVTGWALLGIARKDLTSLARLTAADVATAGFARAETTDTLTTVAQTMDECQTDVVPVFDRGRFVGVITINDVIQAYARRHWAPR